MNEIDLYVELIDDKTARKILKDFNETVPGFSKNANLQQKKNYIRKIFRGQTTNIRKKRSLKTNPFYYHLTQYKTAKTDEYFNSFDAKGLFHLFSNLDELPNHAKFALALLYHPEELKEKLHLLTQNLQKKKPLFDLGISFETREEVESYLRAGSEFFCEESVQRFLEDCKEFFTEEELERVNKLEKEIAPLTLLEFQNKRHEFRDDPDYITYYVFALMHPDENVDLRRGIALMIARRLMQEHKEKWVDFQKKFENMNESIRKTARVRQDHEALKQENKELHDRIRELERENRQVERENQELKHVLRRQQEEMEQFKEVHRRDQEQMKQEFASAKQQLDRIIQKFTGETDFRDFAVVYSGDSELFRIIFPEITAFSIKDWNRRKHSLTSFPKVYFQRDGLNTKLINDVQSFCRKNQVNPLFFIARNEKELIELISYHKRQNLEE